MGSGSKFKIAFMPEAFVLGISISRFPHNVSIYINLGWHSIYFGFGKGYDQ